MSEPAATPTSDTPAASAPPDFAAFEAAENARALGAEPLASTTTEKHAVEPAPVPATQSDGPPVPAARRTDAEQKAHVESIRAAKGDGSRRLEKDQAFIERRIREAAESAAVETERRLRAEFEAEKSKALPASEPPAAEPKAPIVDPKDTEPQEADFDDYRKFTGALARWEFRQMKREEAAEVAETQQRDAATAAEHDAVDRFNTWVERRETFTAAHPDRAPRLAAFVGTLHGGTPIGDTVMDSEVGAELADYLSAHPDEAARIGALKPLSQIRELGKLETLFSPTTSASASAGPAAKTVTTAPAPPTTLAARSADPGDRIGAAVARGDYLTFESEANREAVAGSR